MIDKQFCLSSFLALRYIWKDGMDFCEGFQHKNFKPVPNEHRIFVKSAHEIDIIIQKQIDELYTKYNNIGIMLSGGMDSAILASYLKPGSHAYTFTSDDGIFNVDLYRAKQYTVKYNLSHHLININMEDYEKYTPIVMKHKFAPVHSIEPQLYKAATIAKNDGVDILLVGESADLIFGGMDKLISQDWNFDDFIDRYTFLDPNLVQTEPVSMMELFEKYRLADNKIDYLRFMDDVFSIESSSSYLNAFGAAWMPYFDPYAVMQMSESLDLYRVRNGEPKYLIRELYSFKYPEFEIPDKIPMPRPVDTVFNNWEGPVREEFRSDINMKELTGNQKWQLWCAEQFLNMI